MWKIGTSSKNMPWYTTNINTWTLSIIKIYTYSTDWTKWKTTVQPILTGHLALSDAFAQSRGCPDQPGYAVVIVLKQANHEPVSATAIRVTWAVLSVFSA